MTIFIDYVLLLGFVFALAAGLFLIFQGIKLI
uniref:Cytochrome b6-f complex subunit VI n=1 Tax=Aureoumbra lagunensis TaxID=44058 RepID=C6KJ37_9STRA|nr:cytochrome b6-f complex subunit VI [Aureoumbra lagunensis]ACS36993.1 cytochrome b6-f complex subunit VI [Aureoumbra lagunensis]